MSSNQQLPPYPDLELGQCREDNRLGDPSSHYQQQTRYCCCIPDPLYCCGFRFTKNDFCKICLDLFLAFLFFAFFAMITIFCIMFDDD
jgi:hypothetical protein